jgi:uncharacterized membrane protein
MRVFVEYTAVSMVWGALILVLVVLAMLPSAIGLLVVGPWLGFASWHAYRASVRVTDAEKHAEADAVVA